MTIAEQFHLSVLSAPVAAVDRRALSQAWYSALFAERLRPHRAIASCGSAGVRAPRPKLRLQSSVQSAVRRTDAPSPQRRTQPRSIVGGGVQLDKRHAPSVLARRIEAAFFRWPQRTRSATFSLGKSGRVHVVLHANGSQVRVVALCRRDLEPTVARALEQARYALAARGIRIHGSML